MAKSRSRFVAGDYAHIDVAPLRRADRFYLALLQRAQQLGLHIHGHVADFIEKQRAALAASSRPCLPCRAPVNAPFT